MLISRLTNAAGDELNDLEPGFEHTRWPLANLFEYIQQALESISVVRPELFTTTRSVRLQPGREQRIPEDFSQLLDVSANTNEQGQATTPVLPGSYNLLRNFYQRSCADGSGEVTSFSVDASSPRTFYVNPPADEYPAQFVQLRGQLKVEPIASVAINLDFPGGDIAKYYNAILDWVLYRAFMKDTESQSSLARAVQHYKAFYQFLGIKEKVDRANRAERSVDPRKVMDNESDI
jgi:hypothetical protein